MLKRIPLVLGNVAGLAGTLFGFYLLFVAPAVGQVTVRFLLYLVAWLCLLFFPHCITHYVVGKLVGVRFRSYTLRKSSVYKLNRCFELIAKRSLVLSLNVDGASLKSVSRRRRAAMFASGALASMTLPFIVAFASLRDLPMFFSISLFVLSTANLAFDLYYSPKSGDISRAISREK